MMRSDEPTYRDDPEGLPSDGSGQRVTRSVVGNTRRPARWRAAWCSALMGTLFVVTGCGVAHAQTTDALPDQGGQPGSMSIPIHQTVLPDGQIRYSTPLQIGNAGPIETMIDTGSVGLRVLATTGDATAVVPSTGPSGTVASASRYGYGSGISLTGVDTHAMVRLANRSADVRLQRVTSVSCLPRRPRCPASRVAPEDYRIGGNGFARVGFVAILGIGPASPSGGGLPNPLKALGFSSWTITLPLPDASESGRLVLYSNTAHAANFIPVRSGPRGGIAGCLNETDGLQAVCGPIVMDTGAPGVHVYSADAIEPRAWQVGVPATLRFGDDPRLAFGFTSGAPRSPSFVNIGSLEGRRQTVIMAGVLPYFHFTVAYDGEGRPEGLQPR